MMKVPSLRTGQAWNGLGTGYLPNVPVWMRKTVPYKVKVVFIWMICYLEEVLFADVPGLTLKQVWKTIVLVWQIVQTLLAVGWFLYSLATTNDLRPLLDSIAVNILF